uniref:PARP catalytic domain-containing protein n=1 Tax=Oryza punctata TaxID=4537 RepID=A0A0E0MAJ6_ORYPU
MATAWVRSLSCRSYGVADAVVAPSPSKKLQSPPVSCAAAEDVRDSVAFMRHRAKKPRREERPRREPRPRPKKKPKQVLAASVAFMPSPAASSVAAAPVSSAFLTMAELPEGHSSRRVVELIFSSGWGAAAPPGPTVEAMFRVHSAARAVARFEEARAAARAHGAAARCGADGNEMMRFQCRAATGPGGGFGAGIATCRLGATDTAVRTFAGSGAAHASAGAGPGRRAMLVCRVIAGRVRSAQHQHGNSRHASDYDSVDMGNGELVVLDSRAVLPCFLIIYKV